MVLNMPFKKKGTPLTETTRNIGERKRKPNLWVTADTAATLNLLTEIRDTLKAILDEIKRKP